MTDHTDDPRPPGFAASPGGATPPVTPPVRTEGGWGMPPANSPANPPPAPGTSPMGPSVPTASGPLVDHSAKGGVGKLLVGLMLVVVSLVAGVVMLVVAAGQQQTAVEDLARAPVGCLTELDFTETGTFYVYAETRGEVGVVDGTCSNADRDYSFDEVPRVTLVLTDEDDEVVDLERTSGIEYDIGSFAGVAVRTMEIEDEGTYVLRVESREDDAVVAIGRDVSEVGAGLGAAGLVIAVVGVLAGAVLFVLALLRRRRRRSDSPLPSTVAPSGPSVWAPAPGAAPVTTPPATATWLTPPHMMSPGATALPGAATPVAPPPPPPSGPDDSMWRPPPPPAAS
jgi:hypothetical protein